MSSVRFVLPDGREIKVMAKKGRGLEQIKIAIDAPKDVQIYREKKDEMGNINWVST